LQRRPVSENKRMYITDAFTVAYRPMNKTDEKENVTIIVIIIS